LDHRKTLSNERKVFRNAGRLIEGLDTDVVAAGIGNARTEQNFYVTSCEYEIALRVAHLSLHA
jgi:hypothetical protein